jgi:hypothetical protein
VNKRNGLLAITPASRAVNPLPDRFADNFSIDDTKYARYKFYPQTEESLRSWIDDAFAARTSRAALIDNSRKLRSYNSSC